MSFNLSFKDSKDCSMFRGQAAKNSIDEVQCNSVHVQGLYKNLNIRIFTIIHFFVVSRLKSLILPLSNHQKNKVRKGFQKRISEKDFIFAEFEVFNLASDWQPEQRY